MSRRDRSFELLGQTPGGARQAPCIRREKYVWTRGFSVAQTQPERRDDADGGFGKNENVRFGRGQLYRISVAGCRYQRLDLGADLEGLGHRPRETRAEQSAQPQAFAVLP